jgi:hypothetical protein
MAFESMVIWHLPLEISLLEVVRLLLELLQGIEAALFKSELAIANKATWTIPLSVRLALEGRIKTCAMISMIA